MKYTTEKLTPLFSTSFLCDLDLYLNFSIISISSINPFILVLFLMNVKLRSNQNERET